MSDTAPRVPLAAQIEEVEREIRQRARIYPKWVADGRYKQDTADAKLAAMRAVQSTLMWLERFRDDIHALHTRLKSEAVAGRAAERQSRLDSELAALRAHPAVKAVLDEFPDAVIDTVRTMETPDA